MQLEKIQTSRATFTSYEPSYTSLVSLQNGGWYFDDNDIAKLNKGEGVTKYSPNGMNRITVKKVNH